MAHQDNPRGFLFGEIMVVYKYPIEINDEISLALPTGARILSIQEQRGTVCLWALVDESVETREVRKLQIAGTGHIRKDLGEYIATFQLHGGALVFHAFEVVS
jgi:hypothetical protein